MLAVALLLQAAGPILTVPRRGCPPIRTNDEVVVCARRSAESPYRLKPLPPAPGVRPADPLAFALPGGGTGRVHAIHTELPGGIGNGLAVTVRMPIGRKPKR